MALIFFSSPLFIKTAERRCHSLHDLTSRLYAVTINETIYDCNMAETAKR